MTLTLAYVYDTRLFIIRENAPYAATCLNLDLDKKKTRWAATWLVTFNLSKTETLLIPRKLNAIQHIGVGSFSILGRGGGQIPAQPISILGGGGLPKVHIRMRALVCTHMC